MKTFRINYILLWLCIVFIVLIGGYSYSAIVNTENIYSQAPNSIISLRGFATLRSNTAVTTSYIDTDIVKLAPYSNVALMFDITKGGLTSIEYKVLQSYDGYTWFTEAAEAVTSTVITDYIIYYQRTLSSSSEKYFKTINFYGNYIKLQVKGTGTTSGNSCAIYILGSQN